MGQGGVGLCGWVLGKLGWVWGDFGGGWRGFIVVLGLFGGWFWGIWGNFRVVLGNLGGFWGGSGVVWGCFRMVLRDLGGFWVVLGDFEGDLWVFGGGTSSALTVRRLHLDGPVHLGGGRGQGGGIGDTQRPPRDPPLGHPAPPPPPQRVPPPKDAPVAMATPGPHRVNWQRGDRVNKPPSPRVN